MKRNWPALVVISWSLHARAEAPVTIATAYSPYEEATLRAAVAEVGGVLDPAPEGKTLEAIDVVTLDPIEDRDPAPRALNVVHANTRPDVIRREVLLQPGSAYRQALVDETARNLRALPQQSLVLCAALRGSAKDRVRLLVVTKDVWSLFLDFDLAITAGGLESLVLKPREGNLAGSQNTAFARLVLEPKAFSLGGGWIVPRLDGRRLSLAFDGNVILERATGRPEGSFGTVTITRPLYSARTEWSWLTGVSFRDEVYRRYTEAKVATFDGGVPYSYRARVLSQQAAVTRSLGWAIKNDFTLGAELTWRRYVAPDLSTYDPAAADAFRAVIPVGERRVGPYAEWRTYGTDFLRVLDLETLGLQEDVSLGHELLVRVYPVTRALGSSRTFLGVHAAAQWTAPLGDGLARASVESTTESQPGAVPDASLAASLRIVTPRLGFGRLVFDGTVIDRYRNHLNERSFLGGEGRLRGFPTRYLYGRDLLAINLEYRSRPVELASIQMGVGVFYDVGDAFDGFTSLRPKHSVGMGTRMVFPQIDRSVLRFDLGVPMPFVTRPAGLAPLSIFLGFEQAFSLETVAPKASANPDIGGALGY